jgi:hypothetical protein
VIWDFKSPDIVSILTFCVFSGVRTGGKLRFTGSAINRIEPILSKYFPVCHYERLRMINGVESAERFIYISSVSFINEATRLGWKFRKNDIDKIPGYVFEDINLFKTFLSILLDARACLMFEYGAINRKLEMAIESSNLTEWQTLRFYLCKYNAPVGLYMTLKGATYIKIKWNGFKIYQLLDFIGWDLQRPWNVKMMGYMRENIDARMTPKGKFL